MKHSDKFNEWFKTTMIGMYEHGYNDIFPFMVCPIEMFDKFPEINKGVVINEMQDSIKTGYIIRMDDAWMFYVETKEKLAELILDYILNPRDIVDAWAERDENGKQKLVKGTELAGTCFVTKEIDSIIKNKK